MEPLPISADGIQITVIFLCIVLSAFFSSSETAITSLGVLRTKHLLDGKHKAEKQLQLWLNHPDRVLTTILVYNNVVNILASALATDIAIRHFENRGLGIATGAMTILVLIFGEITPKSFAKAHHDRYAVATLRIVYVIYLASYPIIYALSTLTRFILKVFGTKYTESPPITEDELEFLINAGERAGILEETKKDMLNGVFEFDETKVREIMTPRPDIKPLRIDQSFHDAVQLALETGFTRIPIYDTGIDHIVGILLVKDLLRMTRLNGNGSADALEEFEIKQMMREPYYVPESKLIIDAFRDLKRTKNHMAIVIDEHGGTAGLVTMEDILEEIVGEIQDEYDIEEAEVIELEPGMYDVAGSMNIYEFLDFFDIDEEDMKEQLEQDIDTIAGLITALIGDLPEVGKKLEIGPLQVEVADVERQRVNRLRIIRVKEETDDESATNVVF